MKKHILFTAMLLIVSLFGVKAQVQRHVIVNNLHYHDLSIDRLDYGSPAVTDLVTGGNLFDSTLQNELMFLKKTDEDGNVQWFFNYRDPGSPHTRQFDFVTYQDLIFVTGSVDINGKRTLFIAQIEAVTGSVIQARSYELVGPNFNSTGLHIAYTESDVDGDAVADPGFIVTGFFSDCYNVDINCNFNNIGFAMRTDFGLNEIWTTELDSNNPIDNKEYDFVNGLTETSDGYFLTGSATGLNTTNNTIQQAVLAFKIDFAGNMVWNKSYIFGNASDISVDAYYESSTNKIYALANYSQTHYFGVTVFDNSNGNIDPVRSWYVTDWNSLNKYGFSLRPSIANSNNLVISGYDRDENWTIPGATLYGESNIFVYEFDKATGNPTANNFQYLVENVEPGTEDYNFWDFQMPVMYYPDISVIQDDNSGVANYYHVGYRISDPATGTVNMELIKTNQNKENSCDKKAVNLTVNPFSKIDVSVTSAHIPVSSNTMTLMRNPQPWVSEICQPNLGNEDQKKKNTFLYPNPAANEVFLSTQEPVEFMIHDMNGRQLLSGTADTGKAIDISSLSKGMYLISVYYDTNTAQTFKLLKSD